MSVPLSASMESILDRFEDAWNGPTPPCIEDYLRPCEPAKRFALLVEMVRIDLERRLTRGERIRLDEAYLPRFPNLKADRAALVALTAHEYEVRRRREPNLSPDEYLERWPQYRDELIRMLASHPTLPTNGDTGDFKPKVDDGQDNEETRDVLAFLSPSQRPDELGHLASYRILKMLGSGGMGVVFLAEDAQLKRLVALKLMRPGMAVNTSARQRFVREAQAMAALKHDRIVTIYQVGEDRGVPFLAMEYLEGETLHERLQRETTLPLTEVLRIGREIAEGLDAAHVRGLIHRDIKPANIWLENRSDPRLSEPRPLGSGQARVKLLDFGLARAASGSEAHLTQSGVIVGTPSFMSPEQSRGEAVDHRSDLFSLGCVLYRMVTGQLPFKGRDMVSTLLSLNNDHPKPPREVNPQVPPSVNNLIQRLLAKNIADRPSSSEAVVKALQTLATEPEPSLPPPTRPQPVLPPPHRRRLIPAALVALALFGLTAMLAAIVIRIRSKDGQETTIEVPEGSKVTIEQEGKVVVLPAGAPDQSRDRKGAEKFAPPLAEGTKPLGTFALVQRPARLKGVRSWTIETRILRGGSITCAMRPDGKQLAVGGFDGVIRLYDPNTGRLQQALYGETKTGFPSLSSPILAWSPDGKRLAAIYFDGTCHIWNVATGQIVRTIHPSGGGCVKWSPDGKLLAVGSTVGVSVWDAESWKQVSVSLGGSQVLSLAWSPDGKMLAAGSQSPKVAWLWEVPSGKMLHTFEGFKGMVTALAWSPDSKNLVAGGYSEKECRIYDVHSGKLLRTLELPGEEVIRTAAYSPDGKILAMGGWPWGLVRLFETETWKSPRVFGPGIMSEVKSISWSADGATLASASYQGPISIFNVNTGKEVRRIESHSGVRGSAWSPDGKKIAVGVQDVRIWGTDSGEQLRRIEINALSTAWSSRGTSLAVLDDDQIHILDCDSGQRLRSWKTNNKYGVPPIWSTDGKLIATASDKSVQVWAAASGRLIHTLEGHTANVGTIAWSPDGKMIASGGEGDKTVRLWDAASGKQVHSFDTDYSLRLSWSPDGKSLASGTWGDARAWDVATKELQVRCAGYLVGWSADSKAAMTWEESGRVRWWDRQTDEMLRRVDFPFLNWPILSPNGQFVVTHGGSGLHIGDLSSGKFLLSLVPLRDGQWLAVRTDGHYRGSPGVEKEIVYVVQTDAGQEVLAPDEFEKKYGWKNDPQCVRLPRSTAP